MSRLGRVSRAVVNEAIAALLCERTGLAFSNVRYQLLEQEVLGTLMAGHARDAQHLLHSLKTDAAWFDAFVERLTVGETYFYRDLPQLAVVRDDLLPRLRAMRPVGHRLKIWSAGCATGEEAFTLAMLTREMGITPYPSVLGTDISRPSLTQAMRGRYSEWSLRNLTGDQIARYFRKEGTAWTLTSSIADAVTFARLNLASGDFTAQAAGAWGMDLILCRNVLIYFDPEQAQATLARLFDALAEGGFLVLGVADPLPGGHLPCEAEMTPAGVIFRKTTQREGERPSSGAFPNVRDDPSGEGDADHALRRRSVGVHPRDRIVMDAVDERERMERAYAEADYAEVAYRAQRILQQGPDQHAAVRLVRSLANRGLLDDASRWCETLLQRHRECVELHCLYATLLLAAREPERAARAARSALYLDRSSIVGHLLLGRASLGTGDFTRARRAFQRAATLLEAHLDDRPVDAADGEHAESLRRVVHAHLSLIDLAA